MMSVEPWREEDACESFRAAIEEIGRRVGAGEAPPKDGYFAAREYRRPTECHYAGRCWVKLGVAHHGLCVECGGVVTC
jgi:hypothetical protein